MQLRMGGVPARTSFGFSFLASLGVAAASLLLLASDARRGIAGELASPTDRRRSGVGDAGAVSVELLLTASKSGLDAAWLIAGCSVATAIVTGGGAGFCCTDPAERSIDSGALARTTGG